MSTLTHALLLAVPRPSLPTPHHRPDVSTAAAAAAAKVWLATSMDHAVDGSIALAGSACPTEQATVSRLDIGATSPVADLCNLAGRPAACCEWWWSEVGRLNGKRMWDRHISHLSLSLSLCLSVTVQLLSDRRTPALLLLLLLLLL